MFRIVKTAMICAALGAVGAVVFAGLCVLLARMGFNTLGLLSAPAFALAPLVDRLASLAGPGSGSSSVGSSLGLFATSALVGWVVLFSLLAFAILRWRSRRRRT